MKLAVTLVVFLSMSEQVSSRKVFLRSTSDSDGFVTSGTSEKLVCDCQPSESCLSATAAFYKDGRKIHLSAIYRKYAQILIILRFDNTTEGIYTCKIDKDTSTPLVLKVRIPVNIFLPAPTDANIRVGEGSPAEFKVQLVTPQRQLWANFTRSQDHTSELLCSELIQPSAEKQWVECAISSVSLKDEGKYQFTIGAAWYKARIIPFYLHAQESPLNLSCFAVTSSSVKIFLSHKPTWKPIIAVKNETGQTVMSALLQEISIVLDGLDACTDFSVAVFPVDHFYLPNPLPSCAVRTLCAATTPVSSFVRVKNRVFERCADIYREVCLVTRGDFDGIQEKLCNVAEIGDVPEYKLENHFAKIGVENNSLVPPSSCSEAVAVCLHRTPICQNAEDLLTKGPFSLQPTEGADNDSLGPEAIAGIALGIVALLTMVVVLLVVIFCPHKCFRKFCTESKKENRVEVGEVLMQDSQPRPRISNVNEIIDLLTDIREQLRTKNRNDDKSNIEVVMKTNYDKMRNAVEDRNFPLASELALSLKSYVNELETSPRLCTAASNETLPEEIGALDTCKESLGSYDPAGMQKPETLRDASDQKLFAYLDDISKRLKAHDAKTDNQIKQSCADKEELKELISHGVTNITNSVVEVETPIKSVCEGLRKLELSQNSILAKITFFADSRPADEPALLAELQNFQKSVMKQATYYQEQKQLQEKMDQILQLLTREGYLGSSSDRETEERMFLPETKKRVESAVQQFLCEAIQLCSATSSLVLILYVEDVDSAKNDLLEEKVSHLEMAVSKEFPDRDDFQLRTLLLCQQEIDKHGGAENCIELIKRSRCTLVVCTSSCKEAFENKSLHDQASAIEISQRKIFEDLQSNKTVLPVLLEDDAEDCIPAAFQNTRTLFTFNAKSKTLTGDLRREIKKMTPQETYL